MKPTGGQKINHSKRGTREKGERRADKKKGRQRDRAICREGQGR